MVWAIPSRLFEGAGIPDRGTAATPLPFAVHGWAGPMADRQRRPRGSAPRESSRDRSAMPPSTHAAPAHHRGGYLSSTRYTTVPYLDCCYQLPAARSRCHTRFLQAQGACAVQPHKGGPALIPASVPRSGGPIRQPRSPVAACHLCAAVRLCPELWCAPPDYGFSAKVTEHCPMLMQ